MAVICISRELAANGEDTSRELAKINGYRFIERDVIASRMMVKKVDPQDIQHFDEHKPGPFRLLTERRMRFLQILKEIIFDEASKGDCILLGRGAGALMQGIPGVVCVRLVASHKVRVQRIQMAYDCDERTAENRIRRSDHDRQGFMKYFFDLDWQNGDSFDLTINTASQNPEQTASLIDMFRKLTVSAEDEKLGLQRLTDKRIETIVTNKIIFAKNMRVQDFSAAMDTGRLVLNGIASSRQDIRDVEAIIRSIDGVGTLDNQIAVLPQVSAS